MNVVRERILLDVNESLKKYPWAEHRDLISFTVGGECFEDWDDEESADFYEIVVIVDKDWLFERMNKEGVENPRKYLQKEYTWVDSIEWFDDAVAEKHLAMISFN